MSDYYFLSRKIMLEDFKDIQITEKGAIRIETENGVKRIRGTGIYDQRFFRRMKETNPDANFYIKLNAKMPSIFCNYAIFGSHAKKVKGLLEFQFILYDGDIITDVANFDFENCDDSLLFYGEEAAKQYLWSTLEKAKRFSPVEKMATFNSYEEWFAMNNVNSFLIPDLSFRKPKLIKNGKDIINPDINKLYETLFDINDNNSLFFSYDTPKFMQYFSAKNIFKIKSEIEEGLYSILSSGKKCLVKKEGISEKLSAAIRGTIVPNPFIKEDEIEIGTIFADYLYPEFMGLWNNSKELNFLVSRGVLQVPPEVFSYTIDWMTDEELEDKRKQMNNSFVLDYYFPWWSDKYGFIPEDRLEEIKREVNEKRLAFYKENKSDIPYCVCVGRNPTICQLSMYSARPIFRDSIGKGLSNNENSDKLTDISALNSYVEFDEELPERKTICYSEYPEDVVAINPLVCDGMNADFDGDILLIIPLCTREANIEAQNLLASLNYITVDSGNIRNKIPKEFLFAMKMIYQKNKRLTNKINKIIGGTYTFDEAKKQLNYISREKYEEIFDILKDNIWFYGGGLTFQDMKDGITKGTISNQLVQDLEAEEDILALLNKEDKNYSSDDSEKFIAKVKASNVTEIADSGYFYKKLASCMDSVTTFIDDCGSSGTLIKTKDLLDDEELFDFKVRDMYVTELGKNYSRYDDFVEDVQAKKIKSIHYRSPISCLEARNRCFCKKCCGSISAGGRDLNDENIGIISTLAITENVTQSSLSSMNNGIQENVNVILEKPFSTKNNSSFDTFVEEIKGICEAMKSVGVESRWYEIALLGRVYKASYNNDDDKYMSTTFVASSSRTNDPIGAFLFKPSKDNIFKLLCGEMGYGNNFMIRSAKAKNLFGLF